MTKNHESITPFQLFSITLFSMSFGLNIYPSSIGHEITYEWLIGLAISAVLIIPVLFMLLGIFRYIDNELLGNSLYNLTGNVFSRIFGLLFFSYFLLHSFRLISLESTNIQLFLFDKTPFKIIALVIILCSFVISLSGKNQICRLAEILSVPLLLILLITLILFFSAGDMGEIKTLFQPRISGIFSQVINSVSCFACLETTLFFVCRTQNKQRKTALLGGYFICVLILFIFSVCITGIFTLKAGANLIYPLTELARTVQLKFLRVIERFDALILIVRIISLCLFVAITCQCSAEALSMVFRPKKFRYSIFVYLILMFIVLSGLFENMIQQITVLLIYSEIIILFIIIPILFLLTLFQKRGDCHCELKASS